MDVICGMCPSISRNGYPPKPMPNVTYAGNVAKSMPQAAKVQDSEEV
jgi:hypothetical protein